MGETNRFCLFLARNLKLLGHSAWNITIKIKIMRYRRRLSYCIVLHSKSHVGLALAMSRNTTSHSATEGCSCDSSYKLSQSSQKLNSKHKLASCIKKRYHSNRRRNNQCYGKKGSNDAQDHERCYRAIRWSLGGHQPYSSGNGEKESCPKASSNEGYASFIGK